MKGTLAHKLPNLFTQAQKKSKLSQANLPVVFPLTVGTVHQSTRLLLHLTGGNYCVPYLTGLTIFTTATPGYTNLLSLPNYVMDRHLKY